MALGSNSLNGIRLIFTLRSFLWKVRQMKCLFDSASISRTARRQRRWKVLFHQEKYTWDYRDNSLPFMPGFWSWHRWAFFLPSFSHLLYFSWLMTQRPFTEPSLCLTHYVKQWQYRCDRQWFHFPLEDLGVIVEYACKLTKLQYNSKYNCGPNGP